MGQLDGSRDKRVCTKPNDLGSIPGTHKGEGEDWVPHVVFWPLPECVAHAQIHTHTPCHNKNNKQTNLEAPSVIEEQYTQNKNKNSSNFSREPAQDVVKQLRILCPVKYIFQDEWKIFFSHTKIECLKTQPGCTTIEPLRKPQTTGKRWYKMKI